jgi:hypothetical protein
LGLRDFLSFIFWFYFIDCPIEKSTGILLENEKKEKERQVDGKKEETTFSNKQKMVGMAGRYRKSRIIQFCYFHFKNI